MGVPRFQEEEMAWSEKREIFGSYALSGMGCLALRDDGTCR